MCVIALATFSVMEPLAKHRRNAKYRSGLPRRVDRAFAQNQEDVIAYLISEGITSTEYARRVREQSPR